MTYRVKNVRGHAPLQNGKRLLYFESDIESKGTAGKSGTGGRFCHEFEFRQPVQHSRDVCHGDTLDKFCGSKSRAISGPYRNLCGALQPVYFLRILFRITSGSSHFPSTGAGFIFSCEIIFPGGGSLFPRHSMGDFDRRRVHAPRLRICRKTSPDFSERLLHRGRILMGGSMGVERRTRRFYNSQKSDRCFLFPGGCIFLTIDLIGSHILSKI